MPAADRPTPRTAGRCRHRGAQPIPRSPRPYSRGRRQAGQGAVVEDVGPVSVRHRSPVLALTLLLPLGGCGGGSSTAPASESSPPPAPITQDNTQPTGPFVRVVGTVQDGGLPHAACTCTSCETARHQPDRRRHIASLALVLPASGKVYLVDATPDIRDQLSALRDVRGPVEGRVDRTPLDGIFLTHAHIGHYLGLAFLGFEAVHTQGLPVWATPRMAEYLSNNGPWSQLVDLNNITLDELTPGAVVELEDGVAVAPIRAPHRDEYADTLAFRIDGPSRSLFYLPDTDSWVAWSQPLPEALAGVDYALLDGTFFSLDELPGRRVESIGHPLISQTLDLMAETVENTGLEVYFTHLNHSNPALDPESAERKEIEGFGVLEEGQEFGL
ncbi:MAG: MBL fold metallo-hydrolase [Acidobacteria bacterium]|nr:MAG: MBL fold metallo-hydrolase [Acidobacteriota bacterium]